MSPLELFWGQSRSFATPLYTYLVPYLLSLLSYRPQKNDTKFELSIIQCWVLIPFSGIVTFWYLVSIPNSDIITFRYLTMIPILKYQYFLITSFYIYLRYQYLSIDTSLWYFSIPWKYLKFLQAISAWQIIIFQSK